MLARAGRHVAVRVDALADAGVERGLERSLSALSHWSPVLAETAWLAEMVYPFVKVFGEGVRTTAVEYGGAEPWERTGALRTMAPWPLAADMLQCSRCWRR